ncbi:MAG: response regulator transcription factor [Acidobacteriaceae bacterium]
MKILVMDEDKALAQFITRGLQADGYKVQAVHGTAEAIECLQRFSFDLLVTNASDETLLRFVKEDGARVPVLVLTNRTRVEDRVKLLDLGADDCLLKPFSFAELSARVRAVLRRREQTVQHSIRYEDIELNRVERKVYRQGKFIELTTKEFALLEYLLLHAGKTVSRAMILEDVWRIHFDTMTNVVDVYINYFEELNMKEIGQVLGVVESRVSQIHSAAILKLRVEMRKLTERVVLPVYQTAVPKGERSWNTV